MSTQPEATMGSIVASGCVDMSVVCDFYFPWLHYTWRIRNQLRQTKIIQDLFGGNDQLTYIRSDVASLLDHYVLTSKGIDFHHYNKCVLQTGTLRCFCAYFVCPQLIASVLLCVFRLPATNQVDIPGSLYLGCAQLCQSGAGILD